MELIFATRFWLICLALNVASGVFWTYQSAPIPVLLPAMICHARKRYSSRINICK
jgi:hypothetical protein